jgi:predicted enzyme related to lactoylglutathione lyase
VAEDRLFTDPAGFEQCVTQAEAVLGAAGRQPTGSSATDQLCVRVPETDLAEMEHTSTVTKGVTTMPTREIAPLGAPCWVDLLTSDAESSRSFYSQLFGWTADEPAAEFGGYFTFSKEGILVAGCMASQPDSPVYDFWSIYLASDDARTTVATACDNGGQVLVPAMDVGELGVMAQVIDIGGAAVGVWQPALHKGFGILGEPGTPTWFELYTRDYETAVGFYRDVFRWDTHVAGDATEFRYTTLGEGEGQLAGIMDASGFLADDVPAHWSVYFGAADTDAALATIVELGGAIVRPAEDTPYGRLAAAADPNGAVFKLLTGA